MTRASAREATELVLEVDWARCRGHGHCAALLPEIVERDAWGYPVLADGSAAPVSAGQRATAGRAVAWCPNLALRLSPRRATGAGGTAG